MKRIPSIIFVVIISLISIASTQEIPALGIVEGEVAEDGRFPYLVSLQISNRHQCGGSILNSRYILTAAHCLQTEFTEIAPISEITIVAGTNFLDQPGPTYNITQKIIHEQYDYRSNENDIALLRVAPKIEFTDKVSPIELTPWGVSAGTRVTAAGWGVPVDRGRTPTNDLRFVNMNVISLTKCRNRFQYFDIFDSNICTQPSGGQGTCAGDSGGPLVYNNEVVGVLSWGQVCGGPAPEVYTKVADFRDWVNDRIWQ